MKCAALSFIAMVALTSCDAPGRRAADTQVIRPSEVRDFQQLYSQNCSGCHGANGRGALTVGIGTSVYLAMADDATIRRVIEKGSPGTAMPAFSRRAGGMLTDTQIDALVRGVRGWAKPGASDHENPPPYAASHSGDATHGHDVFAKFCSSCHGPDGHGGRASSVVDSSYLALVSDQHLRTVTITGLPDLGAPDWRGDVAGTPLSDDDVTDVVAWLVAQRMPLSARLNHPGGSE